MSRYLTGCVIPLVVALFAAAVVGVLLFGLPERPNVPPPAAVPQVDIVTVSPSDRPVVIRASGTVRPSRQVGVVPEVSGRLVWVRDGLRAGTRLGAGEVFARVDRTTYEAQLAADRQRLLQAELELELERGRGAVSEREYALLRPEGEAASEELVLRRPQLALAEATVEAARASLARSERDLARTRLTAPFAGVVLSESVEEGQVVAPGAVALTLAGTDTVDVLVDLTLEDIGYLELPGVDGAEGSSATVYQSTGGQRLSYTGRVVELVGQLDPQTRRAQVIVEVASVPGELSLQPNAYVDVDLHGQTVPGAVALPDSTLVDGRRVWTVDADDKLQAREVEVAWREEGRVVLRGGLQAGDRVVSSPLVFPVDGQPVVVGGE